MNMKACLSQPGLFLHLDVQPTQQLGERSLGQRGQPEEIVLTELLRPCVEMERDSDRQTLLLKSIKDKISHFKNV